MRGIKGVGMASSPPRIAVFGDVIVDVNVYGKLLGLSAETPTMVMMAEWEEGNAGGAGFVCRNLMELVGEYTDLTLSAGVRKTRYWVDGYKLFQVDEFKEGGCCENVRDFYLGLIPRMDIVIFSDYRHGVLTRPFVGEAIRECRERGIITMADSQ